MIHLSIEVIKQIHLGVACERSPYFGKDLELRIWILENLPIYSNKQSLFVM